MEKCCPSVKIYLLTFLSCEMVAPTELNSKSHHLKITMLAGSPPCSIFQPENQSSKSPSLLFSIGISQPKASFSLFPLLTKTFSPTKSYHYDTIKIITKPLTMLSLTISIICPVGPWSTLEPSLAQADIHEDQSGRFAFEFNSI